MALNYKDILIGLGIIPKPISTSDAAGELEVLSTDNKLYYHNGSSNSPVVTESHAATLTNKIINAPSNTVTNIINTNISASAAIDATKVANGSVDNTEFQALNGITSNIQTQLDAGTAGLAAHLADAVDAHDASAISNVPSGNLSATDVQSALNELQTDIDSKISSAALLAHTSASSGVHGVTGNVVGTSDAQILTNKDIDGGTATNSSRITIPKAAKATLDALTRKAGTIVFATDTQISYFDDGIVLVPMGISVAATSVYDAVVGSAADVASGRATHTSIVSAIAAVSTGDIILVLNSYTGVENFTIDKKIQIQGQGSGTIVGNVTFNSASSEASLINLKSNDVTIQAGANDVKVEVWLATGKTFIIDDSVTGEYVLGLGSNMAKAIGTLGITPTIEVADRVFTELTNVNNATTGDFILLKGVFITGGSNRFSSPRLPGASSGFQVPAGKSFRLLALKAASVGGGTTSPINFEIGFSDTDQGQSNGGTGSFTPEHGGTSGDAYPYVVANTASAGAGNQLTAKAESEYATNYLVATGNYMYARIQSADIFYYEMYGYIE